MIISKYNCEVSEFVIIHIPTPKSSGTLYGMPWREFDDKYTNWLIPDNPSEHPIDIINHTTTIEIPIESHNKSVIDKWNLLHGHVTDKDTTKIP